MTIYRGNALCRTTKKPYGKKPYGKSCAKCCGNAQKRSGRRRKKPYGKSYAKGGGSGLRRKKRK
jgi:hypothetical protein